MRHHAGGVIRSIDTQRGLRTEGSGRWTDTEVRGSSVESQWLWGLAQVPYQGGENGRCVSLTQRKDSAFCDRDGNGLDFQGALELESRVLA